MATFDASTMDTTDRMMLIYSVVKCDNIAAKNHSGSVPFVREIGHTAFIAKYVPAGEQRDLIEKEFFTSVWLHPKGFVAEQPSALAQFQIDNAFTFDVTSHITTYRLTAKAHQVGSGKAKKTKTKCFATVEFTHEAIGVRESDKRDAITNAFNRADLNVDVCAARPRTCTCCCTCPVRPRPTPGTSSSRRRRRTSTTTCSRSSRSSACPT